MKSDAAQVVALQALAWIAAQDEVFPSFLAATGIDLAETRRRAADPDFLAAVLDYLLTDDQWVIAFCNNEGHPFGAVLSARAALPGGEVMNWT